MQAGKTYSWSRDLSLGMLWQAVDGAEQQKPTGGGEPDKAEQGASRRSLPKSELLRCCPLIGGSIKQSCLGVARNHLSYNENVPKEHNREENKKLREPEYHVVVLYRLDRLVHSSFSCMQLNVLLEAPLRLASNIPFPVRWGATRSSLPQFSLGSVLLLSVECTSSAQMLMLLDSRGGRAPGWFC